MVSGYHHDWRKWLGFEKCDEHVATEDDPCPYCEVESLKRKVEELEYKYRRKASKVVSLLAEKNLQHDVLIDNEAVISDLQTKVEELTAALIEFSEDKRFLGNYSDETQTTIAALKQEDEK